MNDKIRSILPVSASRAERVVDSTAGDLLADIPVCLIRYVKNPDLCPAELLPWLAWEMSVDTWNEHWTEAEKRAAIKRAAYIHRHRGTKAALTESLTDSPFRSQIVEWYEQTPHGDPYTFRLNVEQKDLPVLMRDHQDLKHAVLRAKNLRSWFSVHVYGRSTGTVYAAGYACATEYIRSRIFPTSITLTETEVWLEPGECRFIGVTILPPEAEDKSFTVRVAEPGCVTATLAEGGFLLTGQTYGECQVTVTTLNGISCTVSVKVVPVLAFVSRVESADRPLFFVRPENADFLINYGDGDNREYALRSTNSGVLYGVYATRPLTEGTEYLITVKNPGQATLKRTADGLSVALNPVTELVRYTGTVSSLASFVSGQRNLVTVHDDAFKGLQGVQNCFGLFTGCTALETVPATLFAGFTEARNFSGVFRNCTSLSAVPDGLFRGLENAGTFDSAFYGCSALQTVGRELFSGCTSATDFGMLFYNCTSLTSVGEGLFTGCVSATQFREAFYSCSRLATIPGGIFSHVPGGDFSRTFRKCTSLTAVPSGMFSPCIRSTTFREVFMDCSALQSLPDGLFENLTSVTTFNSVFRNCTALRTTGDHLFRNCTGAGDFSFAFYGDKSLQSTGEGLLAGCTGAKDFSSAFYNCRALSVMPDFGDCRELTTLHSAFRNCESLTEIPDGAFRGAEKLINVYNAFMACSGLLRVGERVFSDCTALIQVRGLFIDCVSLRSVGARLFDGCSEIKELLEVFRNCRALRTLPLMLFGNVPGVTYLWMTFSGCISLESLPDDLFGAMTKLTTARGIFYSCTSLTTVPPGVFEHNPLLVTVESAFAGCTALQTVPESLFAACPLISVFLSAFSETGLVSVPAGLFRHNLHVTTFSKVFMKCSRLEVVPADLFSGNSLATDFSYAFSQCTSLKQAETGLLSGTAVSDAGYLFDKCVSLESIVEAIFSPDFFSTVMDVRSAFEGCVKLRGHGLSFISRLPEQVIHARTLFQCTALDDYGELPTGWS